MAVTHTTPFNDLSRVRAIANRKNFRLLKKAPQTLQDLGWNTDDVKNCLLKLNDKYWPLDNFKNHFYKREPHWDYNPPENTFMDYYRAHQLHLGENVYTHFYIRENTEQLLIDSFKEK